MAMRQYGARRVGRRVVKAKTWDQQFDCLQRDKVYVYGVKQIKIEWSRKGTGQSAYSYWNPDINVSTVLRDGDGTEEGCVRVVTDTGTEEVFQGSSDQEILSKLKAKFSTNPSPIDL